MSESLSLPLLDWDSWKRKHCLRGWRGEMRRRFQVFCSLEKMKIVGKSCAAINFIGEMWFAVRRDSFIGRTGIRKHSHRSYHSDFYHILGWVYLWDFECIEHKIKYCLFEWVGKQASCHLFLSQDKTNSCFQRPTLCVQWLSLFSLAFINLESLFPKSDSSTWLQTIKFCIDWNDSAALRRQAD